MGQQDLERRVPRIGSAGNWARKSCSNRADRPHTVGDAIEVPHMVVYEVLLAEEQEVTPRSPSLWQPGAEMSGFIRPSSVGPQLLK